MANVAAGAPPPGAEPPGAPGGRLRAGLGFGHGRPPPSTRSSRACGGCCTRMRSGSRASPPRSWSRSPRPPRRAWRRRSTAWACAPVRGQRPLPPLALEPALEAAAAARGPQHDLPVHRRQLDAGRAAGARRDAAARRAVSVWAGARWGSPSRSPGSTRRGRWWRGLPGRRMGRARGGAAAADRGRRDRLRALPRRWALYRSARRSTPPAARTRGRGSSASTRSSTRW